MPQERKLVLDTNFLLIPAQFGVDIGEEIKKISFFPYKLFIIDLTEKELLNILKKQKGKHREAAKLALQLLEKWHVQRIKTETYKNVDQALLHLAGKEWIVATQDTVLKQQLRDKGIPVIILRQKKYLQLVE